MSAPATDPNAGPGAVAPTRRVSYDPAVVVARLLSVPALQELRGEARERLRQLGEPVPLDVPFAIRRLTRERQCEAAAALAQRLERLDRELERRNMPPASDEADMHALPSWLGAWPAQS